MTEKKRHSRTEPSVEPQAAPESEGPVENAVAGISPEEHAALQTAYEESQAKVKEYFDGWQRERADFNNYKRRVDRDNQQLSQNITAELIKKYLIILDDMDRAMKLRPAELDGTAWANGIDLVYRKFQNILDQEGIKRIPAESEEFNPSRHEAITYEDSPEYASGQIIGVVQEGYTLGERVLRPARVRVAR
jgi:molecular chaperone GrpE